MSNLKKSVIFIILVVALFIMQNRTFATGINMNLSRETNTVGSTTQSGVQSSKANITSAIVSTVQNVEDSHNSTFGINTILDIILIAIGLVIILLAIAILIRLKR